MSANEIHVGDIGTRITLTFKDGTSVVDISGASTKQVWIADPDGNVAKKTGTFTTDGTDGKIYYDLVANDIDAAGNWSVQGYIVTASGTWYSDVKAMKVYANVE